MAIAEPPRPATSADPFLPRPYRVERTHQDLPDTVTLSLRPVSCPRPGFAPGQFNMLYAFGIGEVPISTSGDQADTETFVHTIRAAGAVSTALARLQPGATLGLRGPFGTAWPMAAAEGADIVIIAGGLGLAPLRPALYHILAHRGRYGRVSLLVGSRAPADLLYAAELEQWRQRGDLDVALTVDHADAGWHGHVGVVPSLIPRAGLDPRETVALVCGPEIMMRYAAAALRDAGLPASRIHLSMERNMKCAIGLCGHCQFGPDFICKDGPVLPLDRLAALLPVREI